MNTPDSNVSEKIASKYRKVTRLVQARTLDRLGRQRITQKQAAAELDVARTTLSYWVQRKRKMTAGLDPAVVAFFESEAGLACLHRIIVAAMYTFHKDASCGLPTIQHFLQRSELSSFVASSIGALSKVSSAMDNKIIQFGEDESLRLAEGMPFKEITATADETFFPDRMVLVMMEPCSNFILAEKTEKNRDAKTWEAVGVCKGLKVGIIQVTGDEGSGITSYALNTLGAHKSPDLFHVQQDIGKSVASHLGRKVKQTHASIKTLEKEHEETYQRVKERCNQPKADLSSPSIGKAIKKLHTLDKRKQKMEKQLVHLEKDYATVKRARHTIRDNYHPIDIATGKSRSPNELKEILNAAYDDLEQAADRAGCTDKQKDKLSKSRNMIPAMVATLFFFWSYVQNLIQSLQLGIPYESLLKRYLIPISYLRLVLDRSKESEQRKVLRETIDSLENALKVDSNWAQAPPTDRDLLQAHAKQCAMVFQRSSSCVEGRNGQLSLRHHAHRSLSDKRLQVLTVIHNFGIIAKDGTTPAERFFEQKQKDLFEHLLNNQDWPLRPRRTWTKLARIKTNQAAA